MSSYEFDLQVRANGHPSTSCCTLHKVAKFTGREIPTKFTEGVYCSIKEIFTLEATRRREIELDIHPKGVEHIQELVNTGKQRTDKRVEIELTLIMRLPT